MLYYTIICYPRTGSNYLVRLLNQHSDITAHSELFDKSVIYSTPQPISDPAVIAKRDDNPIIYLLHLFNECKTPVCGFKLLLHHNKVVIDYVLENSFRLLILERENVLAQYSSFLIARQTQQWTLRKNKVTAQPEKLVWDESDFNEYREYRDKYVRDYTELYRRVYQRQVPWMALSYQDLFVQETITKIFHFLDVQQDMSLNRNILIKQNTSHIVDRFIQSNRVKEYLLRIDKHEWIIEQDP
jgi:LPS sulfotransferase NodH